MGIITYFTSLKKAIIPATIKVARKDTKCLMNYQIVTSAIPMLWQVWNNQERRQLKQIKITLSSDAGGTPIDANGYWQIDAFKGTNNTGERLCRGGLSTEQRELTFDIDKACQGLYLTVYEGIAGGTGLIIVNIYFEEV